MTCLSCGLGIVVVVRWLRLLVDFCGVACLLGFTVAVCVCLVWWFGWLVVISGFVWLL